MKFVLKDKDLYLGSYGYNVKDKKYAIKLDKEVAEAMERVCDLEIEPYPYNENNDEVIFVHEDGKYSAYEEADLYRLGECSQYWAGYVFYTIWFGSATVDKHDLLSMLAMKIPLDKVSKV